jgi:hypothetical protein
LFFLSPARNAGRDNVAKKSLIVNPAGFGYRHHVAQETHPDDVVHFDGQKWTLELPFSQDGAVRILRIRKWTGKKSRSGIIGRALVCYKAYLRLQEETGPCKLYARLGHSLEQFDDTFFLRNTMYTAPGLPLSKYAIGMSMEPATFARIQAIAATADASLTETVRRSLLLYEWYVHKTMTGHELLGGWLERIDEERKLL